MLCPKADRNDKDTQHGAAGEGQQEDLREKGGGTSPSGMAMAHCLCGEWRAMSHAP